MLCMLSLRVLGFQRSPPSEFRRFAAQKTFLRREARPCYMICTAVLDVLGLSTGVLEGKHGRAERRRCVSLF